MVLIALLAITIWAGLFMGLRTDPFNIMHALGYWFMGALSTVIILGMLSWHSFPVETEYQVYDIIPLELGTAVNTEIGGVYIRNSVTKITDRCDQPTLTEIKYKSYPYQMIVSVTTNTRYILCLPDSDRP